MSDVTRRDLLVGAALAPTARLNIQPQAAPVPTKADLRTLTKRGEPEVYGNSELNYIGMPVGGCFAGTVYLGGDGQLWNWDIFNVGQLGAVAQPGLIYLGDLVREQDGANYVRPPHQTSPFRQRFSLYVEKGAKLNAAIPMGLSVKFGDIRFRGEYPIGRVEYRRADSDVEMDLEAFSPFIPLDIDTSSYPATTMTFTVRNVGTQPERCSLRYSFENPVLCHSKRTRSDFEWTHASDGNSVVVSAKRRAETSPERPDLPLEDWSSGTYGGWTPSGTAFGKAPRRVSEMPSYMGDLRAGGTYVVNTHESRQGEDVVAADRHQGTLTSPEFALQRHYLNVRIGGGSHAGRTCLNVIIDGQVVRSLTGNNSNQMVWKSVDLREFTGKTAKLQIVDRASEGWGHIAIGELIQSDTVAAPQSLERLGDFGEFGVRVVGDGQSAVDRDGENYVVRSDFELKPGEKKTITFFVAWRFCQ